MILKPHRKLVLNLDAVRRAVPDLAVERRLSHWAARTHLKRAQAEAVVGPSCASTRSSTLLTMCILSISPRGPCVWRRNGGDEVEQRVRRRRERITRVRGVIGFVLDQRFVLAWRDEQIAIVVRGTVVCTCTTRARQSATSRRTRRTGWRRAGSLVRGSCCPCPRCCLSHLRASLQNRKWEPERSRRRRRTRQDAELGRAPAQEPNLHPPYPAGVADTSMARELPTLVTLCTSRPILHLRSSATRMMTSLER
jgi:hypothetical protein